MPIPLIPAILGALSGAYLFFSYDGNSSGMNEWGEVYNPDTDTWATPTEPPSGLIDIDTPVGDLNLDNKLLIIPVLWLLFKYKPWK